MPKFPNLFRYLRYLIKIRQYINWRLTLEYNIHSGEILKPFN